MNAKKLLVLLLLAVSLLVLAAQQILHLQVQTESN